MRDEIAKDNGQTAAGFPNYSVAQPFELHVKQTQRNVACYWRIFSRFQTGCLAVSDRLILSS